MSWVSRHYGAPSGLVWGGTRMPLYRDATPALAIAAFAAISATALTLLPRHHPHRRLGAANVLTLVRAALAAWAAGLVAAPPDPAIAWLAVAIAVTLAVLDGVDGAVARRSGLTGPFGARFDMEVDAFFILVLSTLVWHHGKAGGWVVGCGLARYLFLAARWPWPWLGAPLLPSWRGKTVAVLQFVGLAAALAPIVPSPLSDAIAAVTLALLTWSFALDVQRLRRHAEPNVRVRLLKVRPHGRD